MSIHSVRESKLLFNNTVSFEICDFGLCRYNIDDALYTAKGNKLPIKWMAIESLKQNEYTNKSDVYVSVCYFCVMKPRVFSVGRLAFYSMSCLHWVTHHIRPCNKTIYQNICKKDSDYRNPNCYVQRKCIIVL